jgi:flavin reductase (DIM6/NTAB) family NADH-FMN oxidoreductase RutF
MNMDTETKKHTLRLLHHNVGIVSAGKEANCVGATITWFTQTSFEPPIVTLAVKADSRLYTMVKQEMSLVVSLVAKDDKATAGAFFKPGSWSEEGFGGFPAKPHPLGGAILDSSPAWFAGEVINIIEEGDHHLVLAKVVDAGINNKSEQAMCLSETGWNYGG